MRRTLALNIAACGLNSLSSGICRNLPPQPFIFDAGVRLIKRLGRSETLFHPKIKIFYLLAHHAYIGWFPYIKIGDSCY
jgi:hypothetical protein